MCSLLAATAPATRRVRAFFAPVHRAAGLPTLWDPAGIAAFNVDQPPAPWLDLGWCTGFTRHSATKAIPLLAGAPAVPVGQARTEVEAEVSLQLESWGKLQLALTAGVQQLNVLASPGAAVPINLATSSPTTLDVGAAAASFTVGDMVVVDVDYTGATGYIGSGASGGYVKSAAAIGTDPDFVRRVSLNVARITHTSTDVLTLGRPLLAGAPIAGMQVSRIACFCDREGGSFFQEWSALFVLEAAQGDRVVFHYPRLQAMAGTAEKAAPLAPGLNKLSLSGHFRALPVRDALDGESIVCYRSYLPAPMQAL